MAHEADFEIIKEFFQLFKTPWELCQKGKEYEVILASDSFAQRFHASVTILYSSGVTVWDNEYDITVSAASNQKRLEYQENILPMYQRVSSIHGKGERFLKFLGSDTFAALKIFNHERLVIRIGYDLFKECLFLLNAGQPVENAHLPTLEMHIALLRYLIVSSGIALLEIPPVPAQYRCIACLTHDVDFIRIRDYLIDGTMLGFLYRATAGSIKKVITGALPLKKAAKNFETILSLPLVYTGIFKDVWMQFDHYIKIENGLPSTFFICPLKNHAGENFHIPGASKRAIRYDIEDIADIVAQLREHGKEIGVHGIDSWHDVERARVELQRVSRNIAAGEIGNRTHWLLADSQTLNILEEAGYAYDATGGYNETVGYRAGTSQVFKPLTTQTLLELPMHIQDTALFYPAHLDLCDTEAMKVCEPIIRNAEIFGGVLTISWHQRSLAPERLWGDFYIWLLQKLKKVPVWFGTAKQVVDWFRGRRMIDFGTIEKSNQTYTVELRNVPHKNDPGYTIRMYRPDNTTKAISAFNPAALSYKEHSITTADKVQFNLY